jgi:hypothetical protein
MYAPPLRGVAIENTDGGRIIRLMRFNCDITALHDAVGWTVMSSGAVPRNDMYHGDAWTVKGALMKALSLMSDKIRPIISMA